MEYSHKELRQEMVDVCLESLHEGMFTGTSGNLSVALGDGTMLITPTSVRYTVMRPVDIAMKIQKKNCSRQDLMSMKC